VPTGPPQIPPAKIELLDYRLVVLTNGRDCLRETLEAFRERVHPQPTEAVFVVDGGVSRALELVTPWNAVPWTVERLCPPIGFCRGTAYAWAYASADGPEFVFWLEDDLVIQREVELEPLAEVLRAEPRLTQMALMRGPANAAEKLAGGCRALRPDLYEEVDGLWLASRTNHSTTCSLMRRSFMLAEPWPSYERECEGRFSIDLLERGYYFGVWGLGEPWVEHIATDQRTGFGY
jgi:hypothetical protein